MVFQRLSINEANRTSVATLGASCNVPRYYYELFCYLLSKLIHQYSRYKTLRDLPATQLQRHCELNCTPVDLRGASNLEIAGGRL